MTTKEYFQKSNYERLVKILSKSFKESIIKTNRNDPNFDKPLNQLNVYYGTRT
jgi:hypothetical protein